MMFYSTENAFEIFLLAQLLCEGDVALTLYKMTKPKGLNSAVNPYGGIFINFIRCLYERGVCIIILHHYIFVLDGCQELVSSDQVKASFWGIWWHSYWIQ